MQWDFSRAVKQIAIIIIIIVVVVVIIVIVVIVISSALCYCTAELLSSFARRHRFIGYH